MSTLPGTRSSLLTFHISTSAVPHAYGLHPLGRKLHRCEELKIAPEDGTLSAANCAATSGAFSHHRAGIIGCGRKMNR